MLRRTGPRGVSLRATGAWELPALWDAWTEGGIEVVRDLITSAPNPEYSRAATVGAAASRSSRPVMTPAPHAEEHGSAGGMGTRRVLVHASGFRQSPYADLRPAGEDTRNSRSIGRAAAPEEDREEPPRKLWHSSQGSSGW